jgi:hypothetical protein
MNNSSILIKGIILPMIIKMSKGDLNNLSDDFWNQFANDFIHYEIDAQPIFSALYKLELQNPEDVFEKLPQAYSSFISELAEEYVLGNTSIIINKLLESKNDLFLKEVTFLKTMKSVITKLERQNLKESLPYLNDRLVFELDEDILKQVAKKKAREDLKNKFKQWDKEKDFNRRPDVIKFSLSEVKESVIDSDYNKIISVEEELLTYSDKSNRKIFSLTWTKYAAAACIVLAVGIMFFKFNSDNDIVQPVENNVVTAPNKEETNISEIPLEDLAEVETVTTNATVVVSGMGVAPNNIKMTVNNQRLRMESIVNAIEKYRELLQNEFSVNKIGYSPNIKKLEFFIKRLQQQLALLKESEKEYFFDGKALLLNVSTSAKQNFIVLYEDNYYLKRDSYFYKLTVNTQPQHYIKISDAMLINNLDDILSENGK